MSNYKKKKSPLSRNKKDIGTTAHKNTYSAPTSHYNDNLFKKIFYVSLLVMLGTLWISGYDAPVYRDEMDMNVYAKKNIEFYSSGGSDTSYLSIDYPDDGVPPVTLLKYYTCGFDYLAIAINNIIGNADGYEYNVRHALNQLFAIIAILFSGLIARVLANYRAGLISIWLLFLTPIFFGLALFNTKDIPFSAGYIASIYFILRFLKGLPQINKKVIIGLIISISFACSIRVAGLMAIAYLVFFICLYSLQNRSILHQKLLVRLGGTITITGGIVLLLMVAGWPYVLTNPLEHLQQAMNVAEKFPQRIPINFDGEYIDSITVPNGYLFIYFTKTVPTLILITFCCALVMIYLKRKQLYLNGVWLLLVAIFFPVIYAMTKDLALYNSWRHFLFVYPPFIAVASLGTELFIQKLKKPLFRYTVLAVLTLGMLHPISWTITAHPYEYMYYNELAGGFKNNYYDFETDYWETSTREGLDWLIEHERLLELKDTVTIATNSVVVLDYYMKKRHPEAKIKLVSSGYLNRTLTAWTYGVFSNILCAGFWLRDHFPPKDDLIHTVDVDGMAVAVVLKDSLRYDKIAQYYYFQNKLEEADSFFNIVRQQRNGQIEEQYKPLLGMMAFCKAKKQQFDSAQFFAEKALAYNELGYEGNRVLGILSYYRQDFTKARKYLKRAVEADPNDTQSVELLKYLSTMQ